MPNTGPPWNIPYVDPTDLVVDYPAADEAQAEAIADGLNELGSEISVAGFTESITIIASNTNFGVPADARKPGVRVTVIGGGGGGGGAGPAGSAGGTSTFGVGKGFAVSASGGSGGRGAGQSGNAATVGFASMNGGFGGGSAQQTTAEGEGGGGGRAIVEYVDLTGETSLNVVIGAGGALGANGSVGGRGEIILEF